MKFLRVFCLLGWTVLAPAWVLAQGALEVPAKDSYQSGIGLISGWHCNAQRIEVSIDGGPLIPAGTHTSRDDTLSICGRSDTGFSATFNWNILRETECCDIGQLIFHRAIAYADGVPFAMHAFYTKKLGVEYLTGKAAIYQLRNFPVRGEHVWIEWDEARQNFTPYAKARSFLNSTPQLGGGEGTYHGAVQPVSCTDQQKPIRPATIRLSIANEQMQLRIDYADGNVCDLPPAPLKLQGLVVNGNVKALFDPSLTASCIDFAGGYLEIEADGRAIRGSSPSSCSSSTLLTGATFERDFVSSPR